MLALVSNHPRWGDYPSMRSIFPECDSSHLCCFGIELRPNYVSILDFEL